MRQLSLVLAVVCGSVAVWACSPAPASVLHGGADLLGDDDDGPNSGTAAQPSSPATAAAAPLPTPAASDPAPDSPTNASEPVVRPLPADPGPPPPPLPPLAPLPRPVGADVGTCQQTCVVQHPEGANVESKAGPAFLACLCGSAECADVCAPSSFCAGFDTPFDQDDECVACLDTTDSPDVDICVAQDEDVCPAGSDCAAFRDCAGTCEAP